MRLILTSVVLLFFLFPALASGETMDDFVERKGPWIGYHLNATVDENFTGIFKGGVRVD